MKTDMSFKYMHMIDISAEITLTYIHYIFLMVKHVHRFKKKKKTLIIKVFSFRCTTRAVPKWPRQVV